MHLYSNTTWKVTAHLNKSVQSFLVNSTNADTALLLAQEYSENFINHEDVQKWEVMKAVEDTVYRIKP